MLYKHACMCFFLSVWISDIRVFCFGTSCSYYCQPTACIIMAVTQRNAVVWSLSHRLYMFYRVRMQVLLLVEFFMAAVLHNSAWDGLPLQELMSLCRLLYSQISCKKCLYITKDKSPNGKSNALVPLLGATLNRGHPLWCGHKSLPLLLLMYSLLRLAKGPHFNVATFSWQIGWPY